MQAFLCRPCQGMESAVAPVVAVLSRHLVCGHLALPRQVQCITTIILTPTATPMDISITITTPSAMRTLTLTHTLTRTRTWCHVTCIASTLTEKAHNLHLAVVQRLLIHRLETGPLSLTAALSLQRRRESILCEHQQGRSNPRLQRLKPTPLEEAIHRPLHVPKCMLPLMALPLAPLLTKTSTIASKRVCAQCPCQLRFLFHCARRETKPSVTALAAR